MPTRAVLPPRFRSGAAVCLLSCLACAGPGDESATAQPVAETASAPFAVAPTGEDLIRELACGACHMGLALEQRPPAAAIAQGSLDPESAFTLLLGSAPPGAGRQHPAFHLDQREAVALVAFLGGDPRRAPRRSAVRSAAGEHPDADSAAGARLWAALNCHACHRKSDEVTVPNGPPLSLESTRVRAGWLPRFLQAPAAIRPSGVRQGDGGRMPDFALSGPEAQAIAAYLEALPPVQLTPFDPSPPTALALERTEAWVRSRLSCLACHAIDGNGGRIGPDLANAGVRLNPAWIRAMLDDPDHLAPGTVMPAMPGTSVARDRVAVWLIHRSAPADVVAPQGTAAPRRSGYLSPLDAPPVASEGAQRGDDALLYAYWCSACHGADGRGAGFNARFLAVPPANHTDGIAMGRRPDDTLHDAIAAGSRILGRSAAMPGFASRLEPDDIRALVRYIRVLCDCAQPAWAADGTPGTGSGRSP